MSIAPLPLSPPSRIGERITSANAVEGEHCHLRLPYHAEDGTLRVEYWTGAVHKVEPFTVYVLLTSTPTTVCIPVFDDGAERPGGNVAYRDRLPL